MQSGYIMAQQMVQDYVLGATFEKKGLANPVSERPFVNFAFQNMPLPSYQKDGFWGSVKSLFAIFVTVAFIYPVSSMIRELVMEKETKIKEGMKMMALSNGALITSWILHFGITYWILSVVVTIFSNKLFVYSDSKIIFVYFFMFLNALMSFCYWVSTLFSRAKTASIIGVMLYFSGYIITEGVKSSDR